MKLAMVAAILLLVPTAGLGATDYSSEERVSATFECPESLRSDAERAASLRQFMSWIRGYSPGLAYAENCRVSPVPVGTKSLRADFGEDPGRPGHHPLNVKPGIYIALGVIAIIYAGICLAVFKFQRSLIYYPQPRQVTRPESTLMLQVPGADLIVTVRPHSGPKAIIYFGGNAEDVSLNLDSFSKAFPEHALFLMHYRGYGGSTGSPSEQSNHEDAAALFQYVHARYAEIAIIGRSLGTGVAIRLASRSPASRLVLVAPYDSLEEIAAAAYPYLPVNLLLIDRYESWKYAPLIKMPTMIIVAQNDEVIPRASTEKLFAKFPTGVASMVIVEGVGHNDIGTRNEYLKLIQGALE